MVKKEERRISVSLHFCRSLRVWRSQLKCHSVADFSSATENGGAIRGLIWKIRHRRSYKILKLFFLPFFQHFAVSWNFLSRIPRARGFQEPSLSTTIVRTLKEDQPVRLLLNLLFYHFNHSEPTYTSQRIKLLDVIAVCNQLNVNALN